MSAGPDRQTEGVPTPDSSPAAPTDLRSTVVRYDGRPDRCTVYPADADETAILTHWLSADADCFVPLENVR